jgi:plastocyanin
MIRSRGAALLAAVALVLLPGCGGGGDEAAPAEPEEAAAQAPDGSQLIEMTADDSYDFVPAVVSAAPGTVTIELTNTGRIPHNLVFDDLEPEITNINGGETLSVTVEVPEPGRYRFTCTYHLAQNMVGELVVEEP